MKVRGDFVTNSSSSSFIIAKKKGFNEKQKEAILDYVEKNFFGDLLLTPESTEEEILEVFEERCSFSGKQQQMVRKALKDGKSVYTDWVCFEECEYSYAEIFEKLWEIMEDNSEDDFIGIETDLSY